MATRKDGPKEKMRAARALFANDGGPAVEHARPIPHDLAAHGPALLGAAVPIRTTPPGSETLGTCKWERPTRRKDHGRLVGATLPYDNPNDADEGLPDAVAFAGRVHEALHARYSGVSVPTTREQDAGNDPLDWLLRQITEDIIVHRFGCTQHGLQEELRPIGEMDRDELDRSEYDDADQRAIVALAPVSPEHYDEAVVAWRRIIGAQCAWARATSVNVRLPNDIQNGIIREYGARKLMRLRRMILDCGRQNNTRALRTRLRRALEEILPAPPIPPASPGGPKTPPQTEDYTEFPNNNCTVHRYTYSVPNGLRRWERTPHHDGSRIRGRALVPAVVGADASRLFWRSRPQDGLPLFSAVVIDGSGSMAIATEQIRALAESVPAALILQYHGEGSGIGEIHVLAENGYRMASPAPPHRLGGNDVDYEALVYALRHGRPTTDAPILLVSDEAFCGGRAEQAVLLKSALLARGLLRVAPSVDDAHEIVRRVTRIK